VLQCRIRHHAIDEHSSIRGRAINDWQSHELMLAEGGGRAVDSMVAVPRVPPVAKSLP
jgi:hypothetical protein